MKDGLSGAGAAHCHHPERTLAFPQFFHTRFARRTVFLFVSCALIPIGALVVVSYSQVIGQLQQQGRTRLRMASKFEGMAILDRLSFVESELRAASSTLAERPNPTDLTDMPTPRGASSLGIGWEFAPSDITPDDLAHLRAGGTMVRVQDDRVLMARAIDGSAAPEAILWIGIDPAYLWRSDQAVYAGTGGGLCVISDSATALQCPDDVGPGLANAIRARAKRRETTVHFEWTGANGEYIVGTWSLFLQRRFRAGTWTIAIADPVANVLAPLREFRRTFPAVTALAFAVVVLVSSVEIRRRSRPIRQLRDATLEVGAGNFDRPVRIETGDELETVAISFNAMVSRVRDQFEEAHRLNRALATTGARLEEQETRLRTILESASHAIITMWPNGTIESANNAAERCFGFERATLLGMPFTDLLDTNAIVGLDHLEALVGRSLELPGRRSNGSPVPVEVSLSEAPLGAGVLYTAVIQDLTEKKATETERRRLQEQLDHAQKMETIGTLAGGIAHDFNNILTPIQGYLAIALEDVDASSETHGDLCEVKQAATRAQQLVKQILAFTRPGDSELEHGPLQPVIQEALTLLRASIPASIAFDTHIDESCPPVIADSTQMHQVAMNLGTNAYHAMQEDSKGTLTVRLDTVEVPRTDVTPPPDVAPGPYVRLAVTDTGHGMDEDTRTRLFEPFFTTKASGHGTGLGLSVVHRIARSHGGDITVESTPGAGSTFSLFVPAAAVESRTPLPADAEIDGGSGHVLVADDEPAIGRMVSRLMERLGYETTVTGDGYEALEQFRTDPDRYDVVLTDYMMPGMNGVELAQAITNLRPGKPVVLISGHLQQFDGLDLKTLGVNAFLGKPLDTRALARVLRQSIT